MSKVALPMVGIFDTTLGRLVGISPDGATDVTTVATVETNLVTGGSELSAGEQSILVVSSDAPNDADGRADGTIYIQTV